MYVNLTRLDFIIRTYARRRNDTINLAIVFASSKMIHEFSVVLLYKIWKKYLCNTSNYLNKMRIIISNLAVILLFKYLTTLNTFSDIKE